MAWVVTAALARLMTDFRSTFPAKDRTSDGTIGDAAHQAETSGHNPDDTAGSRAEYADADLKAEVRAIDVDNDFHDTHGVTMQQVIDRMLQTPGDLRRLRYIIFNRRIWSRNTSWQPRAYTGSSPHTEHAHFSGDPDFDEDASPWSSVLSFQEDDMTPEQDERLRRVEKMLGWVDVRQDADANSKPTYKDKDGGLQQHLGVQQRLALVAAAQEDKVRDDALAAAVRGLTVGTGVDPDALMERINAAVTAAVKPLQDQLAAVQARNLALARALAAAGGALDAADD